VRLAVAPPKGDRFRWLVEKATELGVAKLIPLLTRRTVVDPRDSKLDKLRQTVIGACKQSGRSRLMELTEPLKFDALLAAGNDAMHQSILLHPSGDPLFLGAATERGANLTLLIGPEGGFAEDEVEAAIEAGVHTAALGRTILRTETAAIAAAAVALCGARTES
jgi:16S rRNA (uracil1498-N3)-methyltransferase